MKMYTIPLFYLCVTIFWYATCSNSVTIKYGLYVPFSGRLPIVTNQNLNNSILVSIFNINWSGYDHEDVKSLCDVFMQSHERSLIFANYHN